MRSHTSAHSCTQAPWQQLALLCESVHHYHANYPYAASFAPKRVARSQLASVRWSLSPRSICDRFKVYPREARIGLDRWPAMNPLLVHVCMRARARQRALLGWRTRVFATQTRARVHTHTHKDTEAQPTVAMSRERGQTHKEPIKSRLGAEQRRPKVAVGAYKRATQLEASREHCVARQRRPAERNKARSVGLLQPWVSSAHRLVDPLPLATGLRVRGHFREPAPAPPTKSARPKPSILPVSGSSLARLVLASSWLPLPRLVFDDPER